MGAVRTARRSTRAASHHTWAGTNSSSSRDGSPVGGGKASSAPVPLHPTTHTPGSSQDSMQAGLTQNPCSNLPCGPYVAPMQNGPNGHPIAMHSSHGPAQPMPGHPVVQQPAGSQGQESGHSRAPTGSQQPCAGLVHIMLQQEPPSWQVPAGVVSGNMWGEGSSWICLCWFH